MRAAELSVDKGVAEASWGAGRQFGGAGGMGVVGRVVQCWPLSWDILGSIVVHYMFLISDLEMEICHCGHTEDQVTVCLCCDSTCCCY